MSKIEWTNVTWNPVTGCNKVSQGCRNCYAEIMHRRLRGMFPEKYGKPFLGGVETHDGELDKPFNWKKGRMVFVNSMSDLFHDSVPFSFIDQVYDVMDACYSHTFQVVTKRAKRLLEYYAWKYHGNGLPFKREWPLKNVWVGVSCEDQATADERIPFLAEVPAVIRFLSCEPLLSRIDLTKVNPAPGRDNYDDYLRGLYYPIDRPTKNAAIPHGKRVHWVIAGGESGHQARPVHPDWVRSLRDQCKDAEVPFFFKQWGEYLPFEPTQPPFWRNAATGNEYDGHGMNMIDGETGEAGKWKGFKWYDPMDSITLCVETKSADCNFLKVGKHNSSNRLDGKQHLEFPKKEPIGFS